VASRSVDNRSVYEIGIYHHGDWYESDILDIIDANWPQLLDPVTVKGINIAYSPKSKDEIKALRNAHIVSSVRLNSGRIVFPPGMGVASDGTSFEAVRGADYWGNFMKRAEAAVISKYYGRNCRGKDGK